MSEKQSQQIKARCAPSFKQKAETFANNHDTNISNLIVSTVDTFMKYDQPINENTGMGYVCSTVYNITRNKVLNLINLDPNIPDHTKEKIRKELDNIDLCKLNHQ
ncbi:MAG: hypothetical protein Q4F41_16135 [Eubacteriales bacterium]|nr:hypothetical protein [Eubacteriales bacterium]